MRSGASSRPRRRPRWFETTSPASGSDSEKMRSRRCRPATGSSPTRNAVDLLRFERLGKEGAQALESGNPDAALQSLEEALALWSGRPLPELDSRAAGRDEIGRLEELRLQAIEGRMDAELTLGRSGTLVPELEQLVREHPHRERLLGQLMLALYRCGRQKDALERYQAGRRLLVEKAGLEPAPALQELQLAIMRHDPKLGAVRRSDNGGHRPARS